MSDSAHGMALVRRVAAEHRRLLIPLSIALVVNALAYGLLVYPLSQRVANVAERDQAAEQALAAARREHGQASGALTGKARASAELTTFYSDVLPQNLAGARRHLSAAGNAATTYGVDAFALLAAIDARVATLAAGDRSPVTQPPAIRRTAPA